MNDICKTVRDKLWLDSDLDQGAIGTCLDLLNERGIDFGDIFFRHSVHESFSFDQHIIKEGSFSISSGVGVRAVSGAKTGFAYSDTLDVASLRQASLAARSITSGAAEKAINVTPTDLPISPLYTSDNPLSAVPRESKVKILANLDGVARGADPRVIEVSASLTCSHVMRLIYTTSGGCAADIKPTVSIRVHVVMEHDGRREMGFASTGGACLLSDLAGSELETGFNEIALEAVRVAAVNMEAVQAPSGTMCVVLGSGWPGVLIHEAVGHGLEGDFNRTGSSAFTGLIGQKVASACCTVVDDGTLLNRRGSLSCDDEGTAPGCNVLIENGVLKGYMQDRQNAMLMKMPLTGNGRRESYNALPLPRMTNTYLLPGKYDHEEIIKSVKRGIYAVNFNGGQVDTTSGNFVFSTAEAYLIENGQVGRPIKDATLIGNGMQTMKQISMVGNDLEFDKGIGVCGKSGQSVAVGIGQPTLRIDEITVGGTKSQS